MYRGKKISVCIPCRNEAGHLKQVLDTIPEFVDEIIVVSNKSVDDTVIVARQLGAHSVEDDRAIKGIGYGFAHMTGIHEATGDIIVGADGDGTYPLQELATIINHFLDNGIGFLSCNRYPLHQETRIPLRLRFGVWLLNTEVRVLYGRKIQDILSGMWLIDSSIKNDLGLTMGDWNLSPQIKLNAMMQPHINFSEYHIVQHERHGASHQHYLKTGLSHMWWILKNRFRTVEQPETELAQEPALTEVRAEPEHTR